MPVKVLICYIREFREKTKRRTSSNTTSLGKKYLLNRNGFTLIELLVVIAIIAMLLGGVLIVLNPFTQIEKGQDAQRRQDLQQVKNALETYYQDNNCYPEMLSFGEEWSDVESGTVYMVNVPEDPTCEQTDGYCYEYITDEDNSCPQWNVVFAKLAQPPDQSLSNCPLEELSDTCVPEGYDNTWACAMSGAVNCELISVSGFSYDSGPPIDDPTPTPTDVIEPTPTLHPDAVTYNIGGEFSYDPYIKQTSIYPLWAEPGEAQTFSVAVEDETADIPENGVEVHLFSDNESQVLTLSHAGGTQNDGVWDGSIEVSDTYNEKFVMAIVATNEIGNQRCTVLAPRGSEPQADQVCDNINSNDE